MTSRDRTILLALALVVVLGGFWFVAVKPKRSEAKALEAQIVTQQQRLQTAQATLATGVKAKAEHRGDQAAIAELGKAVPADDDLASLVYQLDAVADTADVDFRALTRAASNGPSAAAAAAPASTSPASGASGTAASAAASLPPGAVVGTAGLATLPFAFDFSGSFFDLERFLGDVQDFVVSRDGKLAVRGRLLTIDGVSLVPGSKGLSNIHAKLAATAYLAQDTTAPAAGATASPSGSATADAAASSQTTNSITEGSR